MRAFEGIARPGCKQASIVTGLILISTTRQIEIADMAQKFLRAETYARVKGRPDKRQGRLRWSLVWKGGRHRFLEEFDVADSERMPQSAPSLSVSGATLEEFGTNQPQHSF